MMIKARIRLMLFIACLPIFQHVAGASASTTAFLPVVIRPPRWIAFTCVDRHQLIPQSSLLLTTETSSQIQSLAVRSDAVFGPLAWSPDGRQILVGARPLGNDGQLLPNTLTLIDRSGANPITVFDQLSAARIDHLTWSPDNTMIVLGLRRDLSDGPHGALYLLSVNEWQLRPLTTTDAWDGQPAWSPTASQIAFVSTRDGGAAELYVMNGNGAHPQRLTNTPDGEAYPTWAPDGARLAFIRGEQTVIIRDMRSGSETTRYALSGMPRIYAVEWSPDGQDLLIFIGAPGLSEWRTVHVDTGESQMVPVPGLLRSCGSAKWAPMPMN
jgi:Tol biopolymer transport system component